MEREAVAFEEEAEKFSRRHGVERKCAGPNGSGCPESVSDPFILDVAHIGGGGSAERKSLKEFNRTHGGPVPNERPGGFVYLRMLNWAEERGYVPRARLGWQCPNCNQRETRAQVIAARRSAHERAIEEVRIASASKEAPASP